MNGHPYTEEQIEWLRREGPRWSRTALAKRFARRWPWPRRTKGALSRKCRDLGVSSLHSGPAFQGRFRPGRADHPAAQNRGANRGSFGAPGRPGGKPQRPIGAERREPWGVIVKIAAPDPHRPGNDWRWVRKARVVWEEAHGPIPEGMVIVQLDGDPENCALPNLACVSRAVLARANQRVGGHDPIPGERPVEYAAARVEEEARRREAGR